MNLYFDDFDRERPVMQIHPTSVYEISALTGRGQTAQKATSSAATEQRTSTSRDVVTISSQARELATSVATSTSAVKAIYNTGQGNIELNIDDYFTSKNLSLDESASLLLLPTQNNIDNLSDHISQKLAGLMDRYSISAAPEIIQYDNRGSMILPDDYPYAQEFNKMLKDNPALEQEMRTVNALSSHYAGMKEALAFQQEYRNASKAELNAILAKYAYLFSDSNPSADIALKFTPEGSLTINVNGERLV